MKKQLFALLFTALVYLIQTNPLTACSRVAYHGLNGLYIVGRTLDWGEDPQTNLWLFPRGMERDGAGGKNSLKWKSKYGSIIAAGYDLATADGMNEKGLVANMNWLAESQYPVNDGSRPALCLTAWVNWALDNFQTMTNSPSFDQQLALDSYWKQTGGTVMLPGTNRAADRYVRGSFYINAIPVTDDLRLGVSSVFSVIRNMSVPFGISTPNEPNISTTRWRAVADQKHKVYYFEYTLNPNVFWVDLKKADLSEGASVKKLTVQHGEIYAGDAVKEFQTTPSINSKDYDDGVKKIIAICIQNLTNKLGKKLLFPSLPRNSLIILFN